MEYFERIQNELNNEDASLWYINSKHVSKIVIKLPINSIKAIYKGCKVDFLFGVNNNSNRSYFHTGVTIYDNPINGLNILGLDRFEEEHDSLEKIMSEEKTCIEFYNELGICFLHGFISFKSNDRKRVLELLGDTKKLYSGDLDEEANMSLDSFEYSLDNSRKFKDAKLIEVFRIEGEFSELLPIQNFIVGANESNKLHIDDVDEGGSFEKQIWTLFDNIFQHDLYKNPQVIIKNKKREFTDILAFYELGIFLIETKSMAVINIAAEQTTERKTLNVQKQISKAIQQLVGANKVLIREIPIFSENDVEINFNKKIIPHCIILVNELMPFGEWAEIEKQIESAIQDEGIYLNVFELMDFMTYIKACSGEKRLLDYLLIKRTETFLSSKNIFIKGKFVSN